MWVVLACDLSLLLVVFALWLGMVWCALITLRFVADNLFNAVVVNSVGNLFGVMVCVIYSYFWLIV